MVSASAVGDLELGVSSGLVTSRRFDPFRALSDEERRVQLEDYRAFLVRRDGELDFEGRTLSKREAYFENIDARRVVWRGKADIDGFYQHLYKAGGAARPSLDARMLWMLVAIKANQMESYGVEGEVAKWRRRGVAGQDQVVLYDLLEEQYHSRILIEICETAGLGAVRLAVPDLLTRGLIRVMQYFPNALRYVPVTCGEVLGCVVFHVLYENSHLFSEEPEVQARMRSLLGEILLDETGHVLYCRARLSAAGLRLAHLLVPWVAKFMLKDVPELRSLGLDDAELRRRVSSGLPIPGQFDWLPEDM